MAKRDIDIGDKVLIEAEVTAVDDETGAVTVRIYTALAPVTISRAPIRSVEKLKRPILRDKPD